MNFAEAAEINDRIVVEIDEAGELEVKNSYLTNYIFRGVNPSTGEAGPFILLTRNKKKLDFSTVADLEWNGPFPTVDIGLPEFNVETDVIKLSEYSFPNGGSWENSGIEFTGASLMGFITQTPQGNEEIVERISLFSLNALSGFEILTDVYGGTDTQGFGSTFRVTAERINQINQFAEKVRDFENSLKEASALFGMVQIILEQADEINKVIGSDAELLSEWTATINYLDRFLTTFDDLNISVQDNEDRAARTGLIADQFKLLIRTEIDPDETSEAIIQTFVDQFASDYSNASNSEEKLDLILRYGVQPINKTLKAYLKFEENRLKVLKKQNGALQTEIDAQQSRVNAARNSFAIAALAKFIFSTDDFAEDIQENPEQVIALISDVGFSVAQQLITLDNAEIVTKRALQLVTDGDGRTKPFVFVRKGFGALRIGEAVGNRAIPFFWDLMLGETNLEAEIIDGKVEVLGDTTTIIDISTSNGFKNQFVSAEGPQNYVIAADRDEIVSISASMYRPNLFDPLRSPWELNGNVVPQTVYNFSVSDGDLNTSQRLCVRKVLGNLDFAIHTTNLGQSGIGTCGEGTLRGLSAFKDVAGEQVVYRNPNELPVEYSVSLPPESIENYPLNAAYRVKGEAAEKFFVAYSGLDLNSLVHTFQIVPREGEVDFSFSLEGASADNPFISVELDEEFRNDNDPITLITWVWGDGNVSSASLANGESVAALLSTMHTYEEAGVYTVILGVTRQSGQVSERRITINVFAPQLNAPTGLTADAGDRQVHLTWNEVESAESYNIYYATESFGQPPDIQNYASFEGGSVIQNVSATSRTIPFLTAGDEYYFVVTANGSSGEGLPSNEVIGVSLSFEDISLNLNNQTLERHGDSLLITLQGEFGVRLVDFRPSDTSYRTVYSSSNLKESARLATDNGRFILALENDPSDDSEGVTTKLLSSDDIENWSEIGSLPSRDRQVFFAKQFESLMVAGDNIATSVIERNGDVGVRTVFWNGDREKQDGSVGTGFGPLLQGNSVFVINLDYRPFRRNDAYLQEYGLDGVSSTLVANAPNNQRLSLNSVRKSETSAEYLISSRFGRDGGAAIENQTCAEAPNVNLNSTLSRALKLSDANIYPVFAGENHFLYRWVNVPTCRIESVTEFTLPNEARIVDGLVIGNQYHAVGIQDQSDGTRVPSLFSIDMNSGTVLRTLDLRSLL